MSWFHFTLEGLQNHTASLCFPGIMIDIHQKLLCLISSVDHLFFTVYHSNGGTHNKNYTHHHSKVSESYLAVPPAGSVNTFGDKKELSIDPRFYYYRAGLVNRDSFDPELVLDCPMTAKGGYEAMMRFLEQHGHPPKVMFVANDSIAPEIMMALREYHLGVPEDTGIVTFNNTVLP